MSKKHVLFLFVLLAVILSIRLDAQDVLTKTDGTVLNVKVLGFTSDSITYKLISDPKEQIFSINKIEVKSLTINQVSNYAEISGKPNNVRLQNPCDIITLISGSIVYANVIRYDHRYVVYCDCYDSAHQQHRLTEDSIISINYKDGTKDVFNAIGNIHTGIPTGTNNITYTDPNKQLYFKGLTDAGIYYQSDKTPGLVTLLTTCTASPIYGIIPVIVYSGRIPRDNKLGYPDQALFNNPDYNRGYKDGVQKIINKKVWTNFAGGSALYIGFIVALILTSGPKK